ILVVSEKGYGKRTPIDEYRITNRGGKGVKTINVTDKTGSLVGILYVTEKEDLIITCKSGVTIRTGIQDIREAGRATQGVKLIRIDEGDEIAAISQIEETEEDIVVEGIEGAESATPDADAPIDASDSQPGSDDAATDVQGESDNTITN
ncbi:MAG: DNA gyrase C-terminal beta-propeller domain-containing protein, partial [Bacteroidota bacterium]